jgi:hypothetical protein
MTLGTADRKKVIALSVLGAILLAVFYFNVLAGPDVPRGASERAAARPRAAASALTAAGSLPDEQTPGPARKRPALSGRSKEFNPVLRSKRPEDRVDPSKIDPTLRLDLLAKVQEVGPAGSTRNLFQIAPAPPKEIKPTGPEPKVFIAYGPPLPKPPAPPPAPPTPPPIPLKYYGIATVRDNGEKTAYFLDGDEILHASEGDILKRRYRIIKIGPKSVDVEDTESKHTQPLPLVDESKS